LAASSFRPCRSSGTSKSAEPRAADGIDTVFAYIVRRILATIPVMGVVALFVFSLLYFSPGDPAAIIAGDIATDADIARIRAALGLDQPYHVRFGTWIWAILHGDLGTSIFSNLPVSTLIGQRLEATISLSLVTILYAVAVAIPLGVVAAWKAGGWIDRLVMLIAVLGFSVPVFVIGYVLIFTFALELDWLPVQGFTPIREGLWPFLRHLILPAAALGTVYIALIARMTRASMLDVMAQDYIRTANAKGLRTDRVLLGHALRNAAVPIVTVVGIGVALLIGGVVVTESVFAIPGLGRMTVDAILRRDYPIIQGVILMFSFVYVLINLLVDLSYTLFDPRIRY
jgi:peptide/nickel transport system permease protein